MKLWMKSHRVIVLDTPMLLESGMDRLIDQTMVVWVCWVLGRRFALSIDGDDGDTGAEWGDGVVSRWDALPTVIA